MPQWVAAVSHEHLSNILGISESMLSIIKEMKKRFFWEDVEESALVRNPVEESQKRKPGWLRGLAAGCAGPEAGSTRAHVGETHQAAPLQSAPFLYVCILH